MSKKFAIGCYSLEDDENNTDIRITKITPTYVSLHIIQYNGTSYSLDNVKLRRKIYNDGYTEYIKPIYYVWNTILNLTAKQKDSDCGFDVLHIHADDLIMNENTI
jgi:hypothetical protein